MFQITCFNVWKNIIVYLVYVYVCFFFFFKLTNTVQFNIFYLRREKSIYVLSNQVDPMHGFQHIYISVIKQHCLKTENWQDKFSKFNIWTLQ